jgi:hypothetical protein
MSCSGASWVEESGAVEFDVEDELLGGQLEEGGSESSFEMMLKRKSAKNLLVRRAGWNSTCSSVPSG